MPITDFLTKNADLYGSDVSLIEINPAVREKRGITWSEYELVETDSAERYRREMNWREFNERSNRFANLLLGRGITKGNKVSLLLMNCLEWLPIYFGILKTGAVVVPLNYRYSSVEIKYCLDLSETDALVFGPEFIGRVETIINKIERVKDIFYIGV
ncbi:MAG: class I adenylate-forming enzyme family protein, partial [Eubacteriales bacterium]|nr:class I adenylate-forming enzyme family protein [Eubacteriales bacterium]